MQRVRSENIRYTSEARRKVNKTVKGERVDWAGVENEVEYNQAYVNKTGWSDDDSNTELGNDLNDIKYVSVILQSWRVDAVCLLIRLGFEQS